MAMSVISQGLTQPPKQNYSVDSVSQLTKREREAEGGCACVCVRVCVYVCVCVCVCWRGFCFCLSDWPFKQPCAYVCSLLFMKSVVVKGTYCFLDIIYIRSVRKAFFVFNHSFAAIFQMIEVIQVNPPWNEMKYKFLWRFPSHTMSGNVKLPVYVLLPVHLSVIACISPQKKDDSIPDISKNSNTGMTWEQSLQRASFYHALWSLHSRSQNTITEGTHRK